MVSKREDKILEEIRRRVIAAEEQKQEGDQQVGSARANREALAEITSFSQEEVDQIASTVRQEFRKKRRYQIIGILLVLSITVLAAGGMLINRMAHQSRLLLEETFDDNQRGWLVDNDFEYRRYIGDGKYVFQNNQSDWCYWDQIPVHVPRRYAVELTSVWQKGKYGSYGFMLMQDDDNFGVFQLHGDGNAGFARYQEGKWTENVLWTNGKVNRGDGRMMNAQRVEVDDGRFRYFVNGGLIRSGELSGIEIKGIALRACGEQTVMFDHLKIGALPEGEQTSPVLEDYFENNDRGWTPKDKFVKRREIRDGQYHFSTNKSDYCYWSTIPLALPPDADITLESVWQNGEQDGFGLMLLENDGRYMAFEVKNDGQARFMWYADGEYKKISPFKPTRESPARRFVQRVEVRGNTFHYWVNQMAVDSWSLNQMRVVEIGIRVCGKQSVAFDGLKVSSH